MKYSHLKNICMRALAAVSILSSANLLNAQENDTAYGQILWSDDIKTAIKKAGQGSEWTADPYGLEVFDMYMNAVTGNKKETEDKLKDIFIIKEIKFQAPLSNVAIYWLERNNPDRSSKFIDDIVWSKMVMVFIEYKDPLDFQKVLNKQKSLYGEAQTRKLTEDDWEWYKKAKIRRSVDKYPDTEYLWKSPKQRVYLYDWSYEKDDKTVSRSELTIENLAVIQEFQDLISKELNAIKAKEEDKQKKLLEESLAR